MNIPFGLPKRREIDARKREFMNYELALTHLNDSFEDLRNGLEENAVKLEGIGEQTSVNQQTNLQTVQDITYLKERVDRTMKQLEEAQTDQSRRYSQLIELQKQNTEQNNQQYEALVQQMGKLDAKVKRSNTLLGFSLLFNLITLGGVGFVILFIIKIIQL